MADAHTHSKLEQLVELLKSSRHVVALTGAGVSTLSGIPDFRSADGLYSQDWHGMSVEDVLSIDVFRAHPEYFYGMKIFVQPEGRYQPNVVHRVLANLETMGMLKALFTQNIDRLHTIAGSQDVIELHGSANTNRCLKCGAQYPFAEIVETASAGEVPHCPKCGGVIKPDIVFYGENLPERAMERADQEFRCCDLVLVLGTSLVVNPAAMLPSIALRRGAKVVIVNAQPTYLDDYAEMRFDDLKEVFEYLDKAL